MNITTGTDIWTCHAWQVRKADSGLADIFAPKDSIEFQRDGSGGYTLVHSEKARTEGCFTDTVLVSVGTQRPILQTIIEMEEPLPPFSDSEAGKYDAVADKIATYVNRNQDVQHLEGIIKIPHHASSEQLKGPPLSIWTPIRIYQFADAVAGKLPLLVLHTQLSPLSPANGSGTMYAYP